MMQALYSRYNARSRESIEKGEKKCGKNLFFPSIKKWKNREKNAAAYAAEQFILQETFLELKFRGL